MEIRDFNEKPLSIGDRVIFASLRSRYSKSPVLKSGQIEKITIQADRHGRTNVTLRIHLDHRSRKTLARVTYSRPERMLKLPQP